MRGRAGRALGVLVLLLGLVTGSGLTVLRLSTRTPVADPWFDMGLVLMTGSVRLGLRLCRGPLLRLLAADAAGPAASRSYGG